MMSNFQVPLSGKIALARKRAEIADRFYFPRRMASLVYADVPVQKNRVLVLE